MSICFNEHGSGCLLSQAAGRLLMTLGDEAGRTHARTSAAILAALVLPVPGAPWKSIAAARGGGRLPLAWRVPAKIDCKVSGCRSGRIRHSSTARCTSSAPARDSQSTAFPSGGGGITLAPSSVRTCSAADRESEKPLRVSSTSRRLSTVRPPPPECGPIVALGSAPAPLRPARRSSIPLRRASTVSAIADASPRGPPLM